MNSRNFTPYIVSLLVTGFVVFLAYLMFFVPRISEAQGIQEETTKQRISNEQLSLKVASVQEKARNLPALLKEGKEFHAAFPEGSSQQDLLDSVMAAGSQSGVSVTGITASLPAAAEQEAPPAAVPAAPAEGAAATPGAEPAEPAAATAAPAPATGPAGQPVAGQPSTPLAAVALTINATGGEAQLKTFIAKLENLHRPLQIHGFTLNSETGKTTLNVTAETYLTAPLPEPTSQNK